MPNSFNPYTLAINAIEKAIKSRQAKIDEQAEMEEIFVGNKSDQLYFDIGRAQSGCEMLQGDEKKRAEADLARLMKIEKKAKKAFSEKATNLLFKHEDEIVDLKSSIRELNRLAQHYDDRRAFLSTKGNL